MEIEFDAARWSQDKDGVWLSIRTPAGRAARQLADNIAGPCVAKIVPKGRNGALDANVHCWVLLDRLSEVTGIPPKELYRGLIPDVGGNCFVQPIRKDAVERWVEIWQSNGDGWVCEIMGDSKIEGYVNVRSYYGSSQYDTAQMSRLIDLIVQECRQQGIETATPQELARYKEAWGV